MESMMFLFVMLVPVVLGQGLDTNKADDFIASSPSSQDELFQIEGKVFPPDSLVPLPSFLVNTKVIVNYGQYFGFLK